MIQKFRETGNLSYINKNDLDKVCFAHDAAYSDSKDIAKIIFSDDILKVRAYEKILKARWLASMVYTFFEKNTWLGVSVKREFAQQLHQPVIKKP